MRNDKAEVWERLKETPLERNIRILKAERAESIRDLSDMISLIGSKDKLKDDN